jgi:hypothetical protein
VFDVEIRGISRGVSRLAFQNTIGDISDKFTVRKDGVPVYVGTIVGAGWEILAAEKINEVNQILLRNLSTNKLLVWSLDANWNWIGSGAFIDLLSGAEKEVESQFGIDTNGDGSIFAFKTGTTSVDVITGSRANEFFAPLGASGVDRIILGGGSNQIQLQAANGGNLYANSKESDFLIVEGFNVLTDQLLLAANRVYEFLPAKVGTTSGLAIYEDKNTDKLYNNNDEVLAWMQGVETIPANCLILG